MSDNTIPEYLQPALAQLEKARAAHLENARLMDETITAIERAEQEKNVLAQTECAFLCTGLSPCIARLSRRFH